MSLPPPTKTHTYAQCISVPPVGIQAERVMGGCRLWGDVNGLGVYVCVCVYWREGGRGSNQCERGNYMPVAHPRPAGIQALNLQEASHAAPSSVAENPQLHSLASCDGMRPRKLAWGSCSLQRHSRPLPCTPAPDTHFFPPDAITHQRKFTFSLHSLCSPHPPCLLPLSFLPTFGAL